MSVRRPRAAALTAAMLLLTACAAGSGARRAPSSRKAPDLFARLTQQRQLVAATPDPDAPRSRRGPDET